jgi:hypothetical protein
LLFVLFCVLFVCKCVLPPGDNPTAVNKYIIILYYIILLNRTTNLRKSLCSHVFTAVEVVCCRQQEESFEGVYNPPLTGLDWPLSFGGAAFCSSLHYK